VRPLLGGFDAWKDAGYPLQPKATPQKAQSDSERTREIQENLQKADSDPEEGE
jgi:3-mercaptopyruvate sulfurtransferase SseA